MVIFVLYMMRNIYNSKRDLIFFKQNIFQLILTHFTELLKRESDGKKDGRKLLSQNFCISWRNFCICVVMETIQGRRKNYISVLFLSGKAKDL